LSAPGFDGQGVQPRRAPRRHRTLRPPPLLDPGRATGPATQVIELCAPDLAGPRDLDLVDPRRVDQEGPLYSDPVRGDAAHGEILVDAAAPAPDYDALENLDPL